MADTVEGLVIEIESNAGSAGSQLDALAAKLENLKRVVGSSTPLKTFSKNYTEMITSINSNGFDITKMEGLSAFTQFVNRISQSKSSMRTFAKNYEMMANSVNSLDLDASRVAAMQSFITVMSGMNNIKVSSSIAKQLDNLNFVMQNINVDSISGLESMINALAKLSAVNGIKISSSITNQLERIAELAKNIQGYDFTKLSELTAAISQLGTLSGISGENVSKLVTSVKQFSTAAKSASSRGRTFNTVLANIRTRTLLLVRATQMIRRATTQALGVYGDYIETLNLFKMAMGSAGEEAYEFAEKAQSLLGIDLTQWMKAQGVFNALASGFGVAGDRAAIMSKNLTQLAYDISSFYNIDVETAVEKVRSGFSGQIRPVRDLGYDLSQARLEAIALSMGIDKTVKSMTQAEKSQLRYVALMTQLTQVQGDLSRTLDSPINQMRILQAQLQQMYRSIGMTLLPILNKVLPYLNAILRVIKMIADEIAAMFGYTLPRISSGDWSSSVVMGAEDIEEELDNATGAAEKLKNTLASFDQINLISSSSGGGSGSGTGATGGGGGFDFDLPEYDFLGDAAENKAQEIAEGMMRKLRPFVDFLKDTILWTIDHIDDIGQLLGTIALVTIGKHLIDNVRDAWKWFNQLNDVVKGIGLITIGFQLSYVGGKNIAQGDIVKGIIESTIGAGLAAYGGYLLAGPAGLVAGLVLGVAITYESYKAEKLEQMREKINNDFMTLFPDQMKISDLVDSWNHELEKIFEFNADDKNSTANKLKEDVNEIGTAITELHANYVAGTVTGVAYANNLEVMYADMENSIKLHLEAVGQAIDEYLDGPFGRWMQKNGEDIQGVKDNVDRVLNSVAENLEKNSNALSELNRKYEEGEITEKEYVKQSEGFIDAMSREYELLGLNTEATTGFIDNFKNLDLNFEDWDTLQTKLEEIKKGYEDAGDSIEENRIALKQHFATMRDEDVPEMRSYWEGLIEEADTFADEQKKVLDANYRDVLESIESSAGISWDYVMNKDGFEEAIKFAGGHMNDLEQMISQMYSDAELTRNKSYWSELMGSIGEYATLASTTFGQKFDFGKIEEEAKKTVDDIRSHYDIKGREINKVWSKAWDDIYDTASKGSKNISESTSSATAAVGSEFGNLSFQMKKISPEISNQAMLAGLAVRSNGEMMVSNTRTTINNMVDAFKKNGQEMPEEMKRILAKTQDAIKPADFGLKGASVTKNFMDSFKKDFTPIKTVEDFKTKFSNMFQGDDAKKWGVKFGQSVKEGMDTGLSGSEKGVENALQGAKTVLDRFGASSAQYWANMSSNIIKIMSVIMTNPTSATSASLQAVLKGMSWSMKGFAKGGFPDSADFFYANENGVPEYIGTMGGRTAVANNTEIAKGIADAVVKAIRDTGIASDVKKIASKDGKIVFAPSEEAGRVMAQSVNMYNSTGGRY